MEHKKYDLEVRTLQFAKRVRQFIGKIPKTVSNTEDLRQLVRSSGSIGANYIEANDSLGKKDFLLRIRISRKEAKESIFWLNLIDIGDNNALKEELLVLRQEARELMLIFGKILSNSK